MRQPITFYIFRTISNCFFLFIHSFNLLHLGPFLLLVQSNYIFPLLLLICMIYISICILSTHTTQLHPFYLCHVFASIKPSFYNGKKKIETKAKACALYQNEHHKHCFFKTFKFLLECEKKQDIIMFNISQTIIKIIQYFVYMYISFFLGVPTCRQIKFAKINTHNKIHNLLSC